MADEMTHRESQPAPAAAIDALPDDPGVLKTLLREQAEALEALTLQVASMAPAEGEGEFWHERLQHFQRLQTLGVLTGGIAHEFNNLLAAMLGFAELTQPLLPPNSPAQHNLQEVCNAGQRAREVIRQTLDYSRSPSAVTEPLPYAPLVEEVLSLLRVFLPKTIDIDDSIADDVGAVLADPAGLRQILMNLCINAAHALGDSGRIDVAVDRCQADGALLAQHPQLQPGDYIRLCVQDNGHGMAPDVLDRIFEPFFSTKTTAQGAGLGLSIANRLVSAYGGAIAVQSAPDAGAAFTVYLPRAAAPADTTPQATKLGPPGKGSILLIDDEAILAQLGQRLLQRLGYSVETCTHPKEALDRFREAPQHFDLVITDLTMPEMNGVQLIAILRVIRPDLPVILCTGFGYTLDDEALEDLGVDALLHKPIETPELARSVQAALQRRAASS